MKSVDKAGRRRGAVVGDLGLFAPEWRFTILPNISLPETL
jgi:hypothetical protein